MNYVNVMDSMYLSASLLEQFEIEDIRDLDSCFKIIEQDKNTYWVYLKGDDE